MSFISFLLRNKYRPEESGVGMSTPVHPMAPPLVPFLKGKRFYTSQLPLQELAARNERF